ncbi:hypothetical protein [Rubellicoccus peritrichatus]|uniref:Uncharacterized protein n=1 Tax=Rubellicoccus peritrichatus TaxID=3080537 RepID=A0AAQ3QX63_9BACT|nr:hypothetical protein [Puniceicoccus sp. CR14]WOO43353.1 hypothetical protein RZN69_09655 [Puniceicoccus sp. CR14]
MMSKEIISKQRQKLMLLYLGNASLESHTIAWSIYDGTGEYEYEAKGTPEPPYASVLEAMRDGWRVIQLPVLQAPEKGREYETNYLKYEVALEKIEECYE